MCSFLPLLTLFKSKAFEKDSLYSDIEERVNPDTESKEDKLVLSDLEEQTSKEGDKAGIVQYVFMFAFTLVVVFWVCFCVYLLVWIQCIKKHLKMHTLRDIFCA